MMGQDFRGNCDSPEILSHHYNLSILKAIAIPKASWGCAPALPNQFKMVCTVFVFPVPFIPDNNVCFANIFTGNL